MNAMDNVLKSNLPLFFQGYFLEENIALFQNNFTSPLCLRQQDGAVAALRCCVSGQGKKGWGVCLPSCYICCTALLTASEISD